MGLSTVPYTQVSIFLQFQTFFSGLLTRLKMHVMFDSMEAVDTSLILVGTYIRKKKKTQSVMFCIFTPGKHRR